MMLPIAMTQLLGTQHRNDMLAASGRWRNRREARLAQSAAGLRRQPEAPATPLVTLPSTTARAAATPAVVAPEQPAIEVRRPLVRT